MRGLFEKDIRIIKNQKKMMLIFAGMGVLLLLSGVEISFILPYMASVMTALRSARSVMTAWTMETAFFLPFRSEEKTMQQKNISLHADSEQFPH